MRLVYGAGLLCLYMYVCMWGRSLMSAILFFTSRIITVIKERERVRGYRMTQQIEDRWSHRKTHWQQLQNRIYLSCEEVWATVARVVTKCDTFSCHTKASRQQREILQLESEVKFCSADFNELSQCLVYRSVDSSSSSWVSDPCCPCYPCCD